MSIKKAVNDIFGGMDVYLFDQLAKGRLDNCRSVLDAGCGRGRNLAYLIRAGVKAYGVDANPDAVIVSRKLARKLIADYPESNFCVAKLDALPFSDGAFDFVICNAVLHFAENTDHFNAMLNELWRVLTHGGTLFARLASSIGLDGKATSLGNGRFALPDGSERFLVSEDDLLEATSRIGGKLLDPIKTTNVQNMRCMTTWCIEKL